LERDKPMYGGYLTYANAPHPNRLKVHHRQQGMTISTYLTRLAASP
jgi:hypothetical protein